MTTLTPTKRKVINFKGFASAKADPKSRALSYMIYHHKKSRGEINFDTIQAAVEWLANQSDEQVEEDIQRLKSEYLAHRYDHSWQEAVAINLFYLIAHGV